MKPNNYDLISDVITDLYNMYNEKTKKKSPMISEFHYNIIMKNADRLNSSIIYDRDFSYNYFGFKVLGLFYLAFTILSFHSLILDMCFADFRKVVFIENKRKGG